MGEGKGGGGAGNEFYDHPFLTFPHKGGRDEKSEVASLFSERR